jgi:hypothetical protein
MAKRGRPKIGSPAFTRLDKLTRERLESKCKRLGLSSIAEGIRAAVRAWIA